MTLRVQHGQLKDFAKDFDLVSTASSTAVTYAAHTKPTATGGSAFVRFLNSTAEVRPAVEAFFRHLEKLSSMSADELVAASNYYRDTDHDAAEKADGVYADVKDNPIPKIGG